MRFYIDVGGAIERVERTQPPVDEYKINNAVIRYAYNQKYKSTYSLKYIV